MKRTLLAATILLGFSSTAIADKDIGCGLGTQVMKGQSGIIFKILGATTNGTSGNQTFGITTGTLGCGQDGVITASNRLNMFTGSNLDKLSAEMAVGQGEALNSMVSIMGIQAADKPTFFHMVKSNYGHIFSSNDVTSGQVLHTVQQLMAADTTLAKYVRAS